MGFGLFQDMSVLLGYLDGLCKVFPGQVILLPELIHQADEARRGERRRREPLETIARVVSSAIFGTAIQWSQEETTVSSEEIADVISQVIMEGVARLAPDALLE